MSAVSDETAACAPTSALAVNPFLAGPAALGLLIATARALALGQ